MPTNACAFSQKSEKLAMRSFQSLVVGSTRGASLSIDLVQSNFKLINAIGAERSILGLPLLRNEIPIRIEMLA